MNFIYEYDVCSIIVVFTIIFSFFKTQILKTRLLKMFRLVLAFNILSTLFELIMVSFVNHADVMPIWIVYLVGCLYYIARVGVNWSFAFFIFYVIEEKRKVVLKTKKILYCIYFIQILIIISTPITNSVFYFDENLIYHHGNIYALLMGISLLYNLFCILLVVNFKRFLSKYQICTIILYGVAVLAVQFFQGKESSLLIYNFICTAFILFMYFTLENPSNYKDKEMDIFNRSAFLLTTNEKFLEEKKFRIIAFQIYGLKYLNKTIGYSNRDKLMKSISDLLLIACGKIPIFRLSRSKLAIIIPDDETLMNRYIGKIQFVFDAPFRIEEFRISLKVKLTNICCPDQTTSTDEAIDILESMLKKMEDFEAGAVLPAEKTILDKSTREHKIQQVLQDALQNDGLYIVYQPIYSLERKKFTTAEALVRIKSTDLGYIGPDEFIPIAEHNSLILQIGEVVFKKVCNFIIKEKIWEKGIEYIHVNLSVVQCMQEKLYAQLFEIMDSYGLDYKFINLEVTETSAIASSEILKSNMERMLARQINFSLDDFGSGFSNMNTLVEYPFKTIKLDKSIIDKAFEDEKVKIILINTIKMVKKLNMEIVAEGVETEEQLIELTKMGCNYIQGYYFSKPLPQNDFLELLK